jgi:hypothetical protein
MNIHTTAVWNIPYMAYGKGRGMKKKKLGRLAIVLRKDMGRWWEAKSTIFYPDADLRS